MNFANSWQGHRNSVKPILSVVEKKMWISGDENEECREP